MKTNLTKIQKALQEFASETHWRFHMNMARTECLIRAARLKDPIIPSDILRASVVVLHACLEDFLRTLAVRSYSRSLNLQALKGIPPAGSKVSDSTKFELNDLARHTGKSVKSVIVESITAHFDKVSFSTCTQIQSTLEKCDLKVNVAEFYPPLEAMISRRHQIVHKADFRIAKAGKSNLEEKISEAIVRDWQMAVSKFCTAVMVAYIKKRFIPEIQAALACDPEAAEKQLMTMLEPFVVKNLPKKR